MRVLMVSPFPPLRDGIGKYAASEVRALRAEGHEVEVLAPFNCAAHHVAALHGHLNLLKLRRYASRYDRVILQYHPAYFHEMWSRVIPPPRWWRKAQREAVLAAIGRRISRLLSSLAMLIVFARTRHLVVVCHEVDYPSAEWQRRLDVTLERMAWRRAARLAFHTERERRAMEDFLGGPPREVELRHEHFYTAAVSEDRAEARRRLGLAEAAPLLVCIGFIQPSKGFDRAVRAFGRVRGEARLVVVGSLRTESPELLEHLALLRKLASKDERVEVRETMLSDEEFDRWILASDAVVLPYREIWSSAVLERTKLLDRRAIVTDVGGLAEQAGAHGVVVRDEEELAAAMADTLERELGPAADDEGMDYEAARIYVREEAARRRGRSLDPDAAEAVRLVAQTPPVTQVLVRSRRKVFAPIMTFVRRASGRVVRWHLTPVLDQLNAFQERSTRALETIARELERSRERTEELASTQRETLEAIRRANEHADQAFERVLQLERRTRALMRGPASPAGAGVSAEPGRRPAQSAAGEAGRTAERPGAEGAAPAGVAGEYETFDYVGFEHRYRGSEADVRQQQRDTYLGLLRDQGPVLDVGCGRGELLEVLREAGVDARGVDLSMDMVAECRAKGLDVERGDAIAHLAAREPASLGAVFAAQLVEHLAPRQIVELIVAARRSLRPGGVLILETINPASLSALANQYVMDLTHRQPVHPLTLKFLLEHEGFGDVEIRYLSPMRADGPYFEVGDDAPHWARALAEGLGSELRNLNRVVFGPQDYAAIARVPAR